MVLGVVADLASKYIAFQSIADRPVTVLRSEVLRQGPGRLGDLIPAHRPIVVIDKILELTLVLNPGAVFGIGAGRRWFFITFTVLAIGFAIWLFGTWTRARDWWAHAALGLILAGGIGNLYDRLVFGCVRDFLHPLPGVRWPLGWSSPWSGREVWPYVSNIADLILIIGVGMMMIHSIRAGRAAARG